MRSYVFKIVVEEDQHKDGRPAFQAYCPDIEEAVTWGDTREEAVERIHEALALLVEVWREQGREIPTCFETDSPAVMVSV